MDHFLTKATSDERAIGHRYRMATWLYDRCSPPTYPYLHAMAVYTALVQLYARSSQLPMVEGIVKKCQSEDDPCRMGCKAMEDMHHIFMTCFRLRDEATNEVVEKTQNQIQVLEVRSSTGL